MRISITKLAVLAALVAAFAMATTASASADSTTCNAEGTVKLSPGLTETEAVQNVQIKGTLKECSGEESSEFQGGTFQIHEKTTGMVTCKALTEGAATVGESIKLKWKPKPKEGAMSQGSASISLIEGPAALSGTITSGPFDEEAVSGSLTQAYTGGATCGVPQGKKKAKKVNKGTVSGTLSIGS